MRRNRVASRSNDSGNSMIRSTRDTHARRDWFMTLWHCRECHILIGRVPTTGDRRLNIRLGVTAFPRLGNEITFLRSARD